MVTPANDLPLAYKDFTVKASVQNLVPIEKALAAVNAIYIGLDVQTDYYFETDNGKLKLRQGVIENVIAHYKRELQDGVEKTTVFRYDENPTPDQINQLKMERKLTGVITKHRKIYQVDNLKIHLDTFQDSQHFIEIEAIDRTNLFSETDLKNQCLALKAKLGIPDSDLLKTGYIAS